MKLSILLFFLCSVLVFSKEPSVEKYTSAVGRFSVDVCFSPEIGNKQRVFRRLQDEFTVEVRTKDAGFKDLVMRKIGKFSSITGLKHKDMEVGRDPTITIYAGSFVELKPIASKISRGLTLDGGSGCWSWWDAKNTVNKAVIFVCLDRLDQTKQEKALNGRLMFVWGVTSRSDEFQQSCVKEKTSCTDLQPIDIRLLKFLYTFVPSGTNPAELRELVRANWEKVMN